MSAFTKRPAPGCLKGSYGVEQHVHDLLSSSVGSRRRGLIDVTMKPFECGGRPVMRFYEALVGRRHWQVSPPRGDGPFKANLPDDRAARVMR
jgi:hypothetical protein